MINYLKNMYDIPEDYHYEGTIYPEGILIDKFSFTNHEATEVIYLIRKGESFMKVVSPYKYNLIDILTDSFEFEAFLEKENMSLRSFEKYLKNEFSDVEFGILGKKRSKGGWRNFYTKSNIMKDTWSFHDGRAYTTENRNYLNIDEMDENKALFYLLRICTRSNVHIPQVRYGTELDKITGVRFGNKVLLVFQFNKKNIYMLLETEEYEEVSTNIGLLYNEKIDEIKISSDEIEDVIDFIKEYNVEDEKAYKDFFRYFDRTIIERMKSSEEDKYKGDFKGLVGSNDFVGDVDLMKDIKDIKEYKYAEFKLKDLIHDIYIGSVLLGKDRDE